MSILLQLGVVDVTTALLICAAISAVGVVLYAQASTEPAAAAVAPRATPSPAARAAVSLRSLAGR